MQSLRRVSAGAQHAVPPTSLKLGFVCVSLSQGAEGNWFVVFLDTGRLQGARSFILVARKRNPLTYSSIADISERRQHAPSVRLVRKPRSRPRRPREPPIRQQLRRALPDLQLQWP